MERRVPPRGYWWGQSSGCGSAASTGQRVTTSHVCDVDQYMITSRIHNPFLSSADSERMLTRRVQCRAGKQQPTCTERKGQRKGTRIPKGCCLLADINWGHGRLETAPAAMPVHKSKVVSSEGTVERERGVTTTLQRKGVSRRAKHCHRHNPVEEMVHF